ncbi:MAG TPA: hypothetical protein VF725_11580 [Ktedonobacterales bacterium]
MGRRPSGEPTALIFALLALVALIGLLLGILTRTLVSRQPVIAQASPTASATIHAPTSTSTRSPTETSTTTGAITGHFQLSVTVSPKSARPGQQITVTVSAFDPNTHAPVAGLPCTLRAPSDGSPPLLTMWPAAQTTDANGAATWTVTAPSEPAGTYEIEAFAQSAKWSWKADSTVSLTAS